MEEKLNELKNLIREIRDLNSLLNLAYWDQATQMPPGGAAARGRHMAIMSQLVQEKSISPRIGQLLDDLHQYGESLPYDSDDAAMLRLARREYERNVKVPPAFVAELTEHQSASYQTWAEARPANDWPKVIAGLERTLDYSRRIADFFPGYEHIADPLIDYADYGMKAADVRKIFADLRTGLVPLIQQITRQELADSSVLNQPYQKDKQLSFSQAVIRDFGYDFQRGRIDLTHHPFAIPLSIGDVRITTRVKENDLSECIFSVFHEAGHAMYEQGCNPDYEGTPLQGGTSAGIHESQSRTWENIVGRSLGFWEHYYPKLQTHFPEQLNHVNLETFYRAINKVQPSLIRTDADEVTYNLHPLVRFELELELLEGTLAVKDLPDAWSARYREYLGIEPDDYKDGVMQDVHWFGGVIGGSFQGYTLGNIISAMFYEKALEAYPAIPEELSRGQFGSLHTWLKNNIYQYGSKFTAPELIQRITGGSLDTQPLIRYLRTKYEKLYHFEN